MLLRYKKRSKKKQKEKNTRARAIYIHTYKKTTKVVVVVVVVSDPKKNDRHRRSVKTPRGGRGREETAKKKKNGFTFDQTSVAKRKMVALLEVFDVYEDDVFGRVRDGCRHRENDRERAEKANRGEDWVTPGDGVVSAGRISRTVGVNVRGPSFRIFACVFSRTDKRSLSLSLFALSSVQSQYKGLELQADKPLRESGVPEKDESEMSGENGVPIIVVVRKHLVAEGWKMVHNDAMDSDTEEDDF